MFSGQQWELIYYADQRGRIPFQDWLESLEDPKIKEMIDARLARLRRGLFGQCKHVGEGVGELKIYYGPGYRIYFGKRGRQAVLLLSGGDKSSQRKDILKAHTYWTDYKRRKDHENSR